MKITEKKDEINVRFGNIDVNKNCFSVTVCSGEDPIGIISLFSNGNISTYVKDENFMRFIEPDYFFDYLKKYFGS